MDKVELKCICIKSHNKSVNTNIISFKKNDIDDVYFQYGSYHILCDIFGVLYTIRYSKEQYNKYFTNDIKDIRKIKLNKLK